MNLDSGATGTLHRRRVALLVLWRKKSRPAAASGTKTTSKVLSSFHSKALYSEVMFAAKHCHWLTAIARKHLTGSTRLRPPSQTKPHCLIHVVLSSCYYLGCCTVVQRRRPLPGGRAGL